VRQRLAGVSQRGVMSSGIARVACRPTARSSAARQNMRPSTADEDVRRQQREKCRCLVEVWWCPAAGARSSGGRLLRPSAGPACCSAWHAQRLSVLPRRECLSCRSESGEVAKEGAPRPSRHAHVTFQRTRPAVQKAAAGSGEKDTAGTGGRTSRPCGGNGRQGRHTGYESGTWQPFSPAVPAAVPAHYVCHLSEV